MQVKLPKSEFFLAFYLFAVIYIIAFVFFSCEANAKDMYYEWYSEKAAACEEYANDAVWSQYIDRLPSQYRIMFYLCLEQRVPARGCAAVETIYNTQFDTLFRDCLYKEKV